MFPDITYIPAEETLWLKRDELMREFQEIRLVKAARQSNPGWTERLWLWIGSVLMRAGERAHEQVMAPRQSYIDSTVRLAV